jgi:wobble nucleotide-excising tRNase
MIKKIDIQNFGSFKNFVWRDSMRDGGNILEFKRLNILYGRNYSGKTTLSRILRSCQEQRFPDKYANISFSITTDSGIVNQTQIHSFTPDVRVYNKDFVKDHLSFLMNEQDGEIKTFAIIGSENKAIEALIAAKETELGSVAGACGLSSRYALKLSEYRTKKAEANKAEEDLTELLRRRANDVIKVNRVYGHPRYTLPAIQADIKTIREKSIQILSDDEVRKREDLLKEEEVPSINKQLSFVPRIKGLYEQVGQLLAREIAPTQPIQDLLNDAVLQAWVKSGMPYHRDKRTICGFCRQPLPEKLWEELDAHFSKESSELDEALTRQIAVLENEIESSNTILAVGKDEFYPSKRAAFDELREKLNNEIKIYQKELKSQVKSLKQRQADIFKVRPCPDLSDNSGVIAEHISSINRLIEENNKKTETLSQDKNAARVDLRLNDVARFIQDINLSALEAQNKKLNSTAEKNGDDAKSLEAQVKALIKEIESLRVKLKDEKKGAEKINEFLNHFFGHDGLKLVAAEDEAGAGYKFQIMRGETPAYNLSEGECSLVSFCYFMAKLDDADTKGKDLILFIDDPVSSLDSNHIFFVFSLIESVISKPKKKPEGSNEYRYQQLFISTHNLDFFKYLKSLSHPKPKHGGTAYFIVEWDGNCSRLCPMPKYLKDYTTEFNYLFHQIYKCRNAEYAKENHECFYSFGNNLRKFLEAYLFYRYPHHADDHDKFEKLRKFFGDDATSTALTNRVSNELSHLENIFDRSMRPIEIPEIPTLASFVLDKIFEKDKDQYNSLLESIGESPREG